jgi:hypothetical protein
MTNAALRGGGDRSEPIPVRFDRIAPHRQTLLSELQRRNHAASRIPGGDPLTPAEQALGRQREWPRTYNYDDEELSEYQLDGWRDAALMILAVGLVPLVPITVCRQLWRRPADRKLATRLARLGGAA